MCTGVELKVEVVIDVTSLLLIEVRVGELRVVLIEVQVKY